MEAPPFTPEDYAALAEAAQFMSIRMQIARQTGARIYFAALARKCQKQVPSHVAQTPPQSPI